MSAPEAAPLAAGGLSQIPGIFQTVDLTRGDDMLRLEQDHIISIAVLAIQGQAGGPSSNPPTLTGNAAKSLFKRLEVSAPFRINGVPGALITGRLMITLDNGKKVTLRILNNRLLQDEAEPDTFYNCCPDIATIIRSVLPSE